MPRRAPQILLGLARRGAAWMPRGGRSAGRSGNQTAFSLDSSFWRSKRKYLAFGCDNPIKNRRDSDLIIFF
jgi:hypothetical protein